MGCFSGPKVESSQLVAAFDAANAKSYVGTGTTWNDLSGRSNTGALTYGPTYNSSNGGAIVFDGSNDCVVVNSNASVLSNTGYTKTVWFYITSFATNNNLISGGNNGRHAFSVSSSNKLQAGHNSTWNTISSPTPLSLNTWYHAAVTFSTTTGWRLYLNGVLDSTNASTSAVFSAYDVADALFAEVPYGVGYGATTTFIGSGEILLGGYGTGSNAFSGRISNASVYNRVLSASEIQQNYNALAPRFTIVPPIVTSGLVLNLDAGNAGSYSGSGTTWIDISGNSNTGTLVNGPTYSSANGGSIVFDGTDDYVLVPSNASIPYTSSARTVNIWFYTNSATWAKDVNSLFFYGTGTNGQAFGIDMDVYPQMEVFTWGGVGRDLTFNTTYSQVGWKNICVTYDGSTTILIYENGVFTQTLTLTASCNTLSSGVYIGAINPSVLAGGYYNGNIAQSSIYNRALSASEVSQNFNATRGRFGI
jgi:hypothetical protein